MGILVVLAPVVIAALWVTWDGKARQAVAWPLWSLGTFCFMPFVLPAYLASRPLKPSEMREGGRTWDLLKHFALIWTVFMGLIAVALAAQMPSTIMEVLPTIGRFRPPAVPGRVWESAAMVGAPSMLIMLGGMAWLIPVIGALLIGSLAKDSSVIELGPTAGWPMGQSQLPSTEAEIRVVDGAVLAARRAASVHGGGKRNGGHSSLVTAVREEVPMLAFLAFDPALRLLEGTLETVAGDHRGMLTEPEYRARVGLASMVYARVGPLCSAFLQVVRGLQPVEAPEPEARKSPLNLPARFFRASAWEGLPDGQRRTLGTVLENVFALGILQHLVLWSYPTREHVERVDFDALYKSWCLEATAAAHMMEGINQHGTIQAEAIFEAYWHSGARDTLRRCFRLGFWGVRRWRAYFRNLFYAGALLAMSLDLMTSRPR